MNLLLDTHTVIWFITDDNQLTTKVKNLIETGSNNCFVSIASLWEMAVKYSLGKLKLGDSLQKIFELIDLSGINILPITKDHILINTFLEFHHRDPFDRLIVAQAKSEKMTLLSRDKILGKYDLKIVW